MSAPGRLVAFVAVVVVTCAAAFGVGRLTAPDQPVPPHPVTHTGDHPGN